MKKNIYIAFIVSITFLVIGYAQQNDIKYYQKLNISDGLAHNGVTSIIEDSKGFFWFGTYDGINRYDGYEVKTYKNTIDKDILTSNRVRSLNEDDKGNLWIGTEGGITIYDRVLEKFIKIYSNNILKNEISGPIVRDIIVDKESGVVLCVTESKGLLLFNEDYSFIGEYRLKQQETQNILFNKIIPLTKLDYLVATSKGFWLFNLQTKQFTLVLKFPGSTALQVNENTLLVALPYGIAVVEFNLGEAISFKLKHRVLKSRKFNSLMLDELNNLWLGTLNEGVLFIDDLTSLLVNDDELDIKYFNNSLKIFRTSCIIKSSNNNCWVGTFNEGAFQLNTNSNPFKNYNVKMDYKDGLYSNSITHFASLDEDRVYVTASQEGGLALFNTKKQEFEPLPFYLPKEKLLDVSAVFVDSNKNTWLRINGEEGLRRKLKNSNILEEIFVDYFSKGKTSGKRTIRSINEDKFGNLWIGTNNNVIRININEEGKVKEELLSEHSFFKKDKLSLARFVYVDPAYDFIWLAGDFDGLFRLKNDENIPLRDIKVDQFLKDKNNKKSISSNFVTSIVRLPNNDFWIGTEGGGVCKVLRSSFEPEFFPYTEKDGLSNNVVKNILFDNDYNLWIPTNIGLNKLNPKNGEIRKFNVSDGLNFEDFWFAATRLKNGTILLSGLDGFCYFNPNDLYDTEKLPEVQIENFKIFNKTIKPKDTVNGRVLLPKSLSVIDEIVLKHNENVFSLDILSLHFLNPKNHSLKYRLMPINKEWIEVSSNQKNISYSGLQPDEYRLDFMASNSLNDWTPIKSIKIKIKPSIWKTKLAYTIYSLLSILLIFAIGRMILKIQALNHKVTIEKLEKNNVHEINEAKLRFFANISHEIKTPLTLISRPLEMLSEKFQNNVDVNEKLNLINRQSKKIQQLIEQVVDFRRADAKVLKMNYSRFNFESFIRDFIIDFDFMAENDHKKLIIKGDDSNIIVSADYDKLEKIFNNILNNAFKYTKSDDVITISYESQEKDLIVTVEDTGVGIDSVDLEHIFERFYQSRKKNNAHISGSGIGLAFSKRLVEMHYGFISAQSEINKGTIITVRLPIVKKHLPSDVLEEFALPTENEVAVDKKIIQGDYSPSKIKGTGDFAESLVFYAEDNLEMRNFVSNLLSKFFKVKSFRNGKECLDAMDNEWPDIVISDVQMPEMNGLDLCLRIKSDLKTSHIPVILLTALSNIEDYLQGIRDGADAYIKKPFNVQHLVTNTEALLATRKLLRERYQIGMPLTKENNKNNRNDNAFLEKLYSLIEENLDNQNFDLNALAKELYLNRTHFYQKVKELTNQTPFEVLKEYRLKKAAELLSQKKFTVNEVFLMTGFKSRTHFAKIFKEKFNTSPSKYASELNKKYEI